MNKDKNTLLLATALAVVSSSMAQAGTLKVINKHPTEDIRLYIHSELNPDQEGNSYVPLVEAGAQGEYIIKKEDAQGDNTYEVVVARSDVRPSDLNLMGATCSNLVTDEDYIIKIDSTLGKLSCTAEKSNTPSR